MAEDRDEQCPNCGNDSVHVLHAPDGEDFPYDTYELECENCGAQF